MLWLIWMLSVRIDLFAIHFVRLSANTCGFYIVRFFVKHLNSLIRHSNFEWFKFDALFQGVLSVRANSQSLDLEGWRRSFDVHGSHRPGKPPDHLERTRLMSGSFKILNSLPEPSECFKPCASLIIFFNFHNPFILALVYVMNFGKQEELFMRRSNQGVHTSCERFAIGQKSYL